ncbi:general secretion pathway protein GspD [Vibrio sp. 03-59-1]|uniref:secretin N-terminal domain-containing protein n=1 Tax=Vibrio sp. 03-59-1 TaxID=2607607 RepID=UPI001493998D|nr:secretin N-terminal domain-containing protein [Vibrio sp. 03-59-1]NOH84547.1 general secretion pathway protein GspD [Vibrio sp. 03-59-1]
MRKQFILTLPALLVLTACSTLPTEPVKIAPSYLEGSEAPLKATPPFQVQTGPSEKKKPSITYTKIPTFSVNRDAGGDELDLTKQFSAVDVVTIAADSLPLNQFLHYVMGEVLQVSYILDNSAKNDNSGITLNIQKPVSKRKLYTLVEDVLIQGGYQLTFKDDIFYINKASEDNAGNVVIGYGRNIKDVPRTSVDINQIVPLNFPVKSGMHLTLQQLAKVKATVDYDQNSFIIKGRRSEVIKALEFIHLVDAPAFQNRQVTMYKSTFIPADELAENLTAILNNEGITVKGDQPKQNAVTILPIERISSVILFANDFQLLKRAGFWLKKLDQPSMVEEVQYFTYVPKYARASDIEESLSPLLSGAGVKAASTKDKTSAKTIGSPNKSSASGNDKVKLVVDPRSNSLIVQTTGEEYQRLLPLIKRMDVMPKQVMLEVMIAEVTLVDEFKQGIEFAFNSGELSIGTKGALGVSKFGGFSFGLKGVDGELIANFFESNTHTNILSRPSVVVRDGVSADMNVGTDIPVVGETTSDPDGDRQTTSIQYRKTGVQLMVTPTVNSQGVVIMEISQVSSNEADAGTTSAISPSIFERSIKTEVVAESGQAVILGGLISNNTNKVETKVPFLGDLPWIGGLFRANVDKSTKTELVVIVTPRIIESSEEWRDIKASFSEQMTQLDVNHSQQ